MFRMVFKNVFRQECCIFNELSGSVFGSAWDCINREIQPLEVGVSKNDDFHENDNSDLKIKDFLKKFQKYFFLRISHINSSLPLIFINQKFSLVSLYITEKTAS